MDGMIELPRFRTVALGYSKEDIANYLDLIGNEILRSKEIIKENASLRDQIGVLQLYRDNYEEQKDLIAQALIDAREAATNIIKEAEDIAAKIVREAESRAKEILTKAKEEANITINAANAAVARKEEEFNKIQGKIEELRNMLNKA